MNKIQIRSDGPPDNALVGSFDDFQTEFSVEKVLQSLGEKECLARANNTKEIGPASDELSLVKEIYRLGLR